MNTNHIDHKLREELRATALDLYKKGFNVVPVTGKAPIGGWKQRLSEEELEKRLQSDELTGIAIVGGELHSEDKKGYIAVLIDVDNPLILEKTPKLFELLTLTACWKTGGRCPKCMGKALERVEDKFKCKECGEEFSKEEAKRGLGALIFVKKEDNITLTTVRELKVVEFLVNNYQLIPPSLHPSGFQYEWVNEYDKGVHVLTVNQFNEIVEEVRKAVKGDKDRKVLEDKEELTETNPPPPSPPHPPPPHPPPPPPRTAPAPRPPAPPGKAR